MNRGRDRQPGLAAQVRRFGRRVTQMVETEGQSLRPMSRRSRALILLTVAGSLVAHSQGRKAVADERYHGMDADLMTMLEESVEQGGIKGIAVATPLLYAGHVAIGAVDLASAVKGRLTLGERASRALDGGDVPHVINQDTVLKSVDEVTPQMSEWMRGELLSAQHDQLGRELERMGKAERSIARALQAREASEIEAIAKEFSVYGVAGDFETMRANLIAGIKGSMEMSPTNVAQIRSEIERLEKASEREMAQVFFDQMLQYGSVEALMGDDFEILSRPGPRRGPKR